MKKLALLTLSLILAGPLFGLEDERPSLLVELNTGYAAGIDLPNAVPVELKLVYPFTWFGLTLEAGALLSDTAALHIFFGPSFFIINSPKIRLPLSVGADLLLDGNNRSWFGLGGMVSFHYRLGKRIYLGINIELDYDFNNPYEETTGYKDAAIGVDVNGGKVYPQGPGGDAVKYTPIRETKNHFGNSLYIKPSVGIGLQF